MKLSCVETGCEYEFTQVPLTFNGKSYRDIFGEKNNKTVAETLEHRRYAKLKNEVTEKYHKSLDKPLGIFLLGLKKDGDGFYKNFLNKYGDLAYTIFTISDRAYFDCTGVYGYQSDNELKYIGRCKDSMKKRVNQGYGKIHPKNCYLDGQATNCHLNARITDTKSNITLWLHQMDIPSEIKALEMALIRAYNPTWNIQRG